MANNNKRRARPQRRPATIKEIEQRERIFNIIKLVFLYILIVVFAAVILVPFLWMLLSSMKSTGETSNKFVLFPSELMPVNWFHDNYIRVLNQIKFGTLLKNTLFVGVCTTAGTLVTTILAAYAFAKLNFKGRDLIFMIMLSTMMIPGEMMTVTNFITVSRLNWINTYQVLIIPFITSTFYVFFLRQTIRQIPHQLYQAARIDGVGDFKFMMRVVLPIAKPTIITITILGVIGAWNAYIWPNLVTNTDNMRLISNGIRIALVDPQSGRPSAALQMAASTVVTLPLLIVFLLLKRYIIRGVSRSGIKG